LTRTRTEPNPINDGSFPSLVESGRGNYAWRYTGTILFKFRHGAKLMVLHRYAGGGLTGARCK